MVGLTFSKIYIMRNAIYICLPHLAIVDLFPDCPFKLL